MPPVVQKQSGSLSMVPPKTNNQPVGNSPAPHPKVTPKEIEPGMKLSVFGRGKTGKTRLACTFPKPLLLIGTEDGTKSIKTSRKLKARITDTAGNVAEVYSLFLREKATGVDFVQIHNSTMLDFITTNVMKNYRSGVLDNGGGFQDILVKEIAGLAETPAQLSYGTMSQQEWGILTGQFKDQLRKLLALADTAGKHIVIIAHEQNFTPENTTPGLMLPSVGPALTPKCSGWLSTACDYLSQTFIREEIVEAAATEEGEMPVAMKTGRKQFCLRVAPHEVFMTGFRVPEGVELPQDGIASPTFEKIQAMIEGRPVI